MLVGLVGNVLAVFFLVLVGDDVAEFVLGPLEQPLEDPGAVVGIGDNEGAPPVGGNLLNTSTWNPGKGEFAASPCCIPVPTKQSWRPFARKGP